MPHEHIFHIYKPLLIIVQLLKWIINSIQYKNVPYNRLTKQNSCQDMARQRLDAFAGVLLTTFLHANTNKHFSEPLKQKLKHRK